MAKPEGYGKRYFEILSIFKKYRLIKGFKKSLSKKDNIKAQEKFGTNLRLACEELGATFIKFGQILSTRNDIFSKEVISELEKLQDEVPPISYEDFKRVIVEDLGDLSRFSFIDENYFATGSIAQVHKATLTDGRSVVVKVKRPNIEKKIEIDILILDKLADFFQKFSFASQFDLKGIVKYFDIQIKKEMDFRVEGHNLHEFEKYNRRDKYVRVPFLVDDLVTKRLMVMEDIQKPSLKDVILNKEKYDTVEISRRLLYSYSNQVFKDGFFHADPHPGNILIENSNEIIFIDFGIVGTIPPKMRYGLLKLLYGVTKNNPRIIIDGCRDMGLINGKINLSIFEKQIVMLLDKYLYITLSDIVVADIIEDFLDLLRKNRIHIPSSLTLLGKTFIMLEGIVEHIGSDENILQIATPLAEKLKNRFISRDYLSLFTYPAIYDLLALTEELPAFALDGVRTLKDNNYVIKHEYGENDQIREDKSRTERLSIVKLLFALSTFFVLTSILINYYVNGGSLRAFEGFMGFALGLNSIIMIFSFIILVKNILYRK